MTRARRATCWTAFRRSSTGDVWVPLSTNCTSALSSGRLRTSCDVWVSLNTTCKPALSSGRPRTSCDAPCMCRYMPNGKIKRPDDARTSLSEGGNCHMGRGASYDSSMVESMQTMTCRKIHTNYTHVVVRCKDYYGNRQQTDLEMRREKSVAPDWMVSAMKRHVHIHTRTHAWPLVVLYLVFLTKCLACVCETRCSAQGKEAEVQHVFGSAQVDDRRRSTRTAARPRGLVWRAVPLVCVTDAGGRHACHGVW